MDVIAGIVVVALLGFIAGYGACLQGTKQMIASGELVKREDVKRIVRLRERL